MWRVNWLELSSLDSDLQRVVVAWDDLLGVIRKAITALGGAQM